MLKLRKLRRFLRERDPELLFHGDIAWKCMDNPSDKQDARYKNCDIRVPGIVVCGAVNPFSKPYRMIDGSHRMARMALETGIDASSFYVLSNDEFLKLLEDLPA